MLIPKKKKKPIHLSLNAIQKHLEDQSIIQSINQSINQLIMMTYN